LLYTLYNKSGRLKDVLIQIEPQSEVPIYIQLANQIMEGIARGHMNAGDSLPSVRSLAADLGVNMHTVNKSYRELEKKGIIRIVPKSGAIILKPEPSPNHFARLRREFQPLIAEAMVLGMVGQDIQELVHAILADLKGE
jgi:GntR family transcriptional regulator